MFRLLLSALAAFVVVRVVIGLTRAIAAALRDGRHETVGGGRRAEGSPSGSMRQSPLGGPLARGPAIDRSAVIDVPYTEVEAEEPSAPGRERRAG